MCKFCVFRPSSLFSSCLVERDWLLIRTLVAFLHDITVVQQLQQPQTKKTKRGTKERTREKRKRNKAIASAGTSTFTLKLGSVRCARNYEFYTCTSYFNSSIVFRSRFIAIGHDKHKRQFYICFNVHCIRVARTRQISNHSIAIPRASVITFHAAPLGHIVCLPWGGNSHSAHTRARHQYAACAATSKHENLTQLLPLRWPRRPGPRPLLVRLRGTTPPRRSTARDRISGSQMRVRAQWMVGCAPRSWPQWDWGCGAKTQTKAVGWGQQEN